MAKSQQSEYAVGTVLEVEEHASGEQYFLVSLVAAEDMSLSPYQDRPIVVKAHDRTAAEDKFRAVYGIRKTVHSIVADPATAQQWANQLKINERPEERLSREETLARLNA